MGFYINTFLIGSVLVGTGAIAQAKDSDAKTKPPVAADNTKKNADDHSPTADDQSNNSEDVKLVAAIRRSIMDAKDISVNGQNIKIITKGSHVTIRGPVNSPAEKRRLGILAAAVKGVTDVVNELEVTTK